MGHKRVILKESEDIDVATLQQIEKFEQINKTTLPVKGPKRKKTVRVAPRTTVTEYNPQAEIDTLRAQNKVQKDILDKIDDVVLQSFYNYEPVQTYCEKKGSIEIDQILKIVHIMYEKRGENLQKAADANTDLQKKLTTAQANEANARGKLGMEKEKNKDHGSMKKAVTEKAAEVISLASQLKTAN